ncbi:MAG: DMT family transporter [Myxococcales bacterium]|nr:DMT family transporter [Myxococcales bacterium]
MTTAAREGTPAQMHPAALVAFLLGCVAVVQAGLNRRIAGTAGLATAVLYNGFVVLAFCGLFYAAARRGLVGSVPEGVSFRWWWLVPGVLGFSLITGLPWAIARIGSLQVFVAAVAAQMVASLAWDAWVEGIPFNALRAAGAAVCVIGVALALYGSR